MKVERLPLYRCFFYHSIKIRHPCKSELFKEMLQFPIFYIFDLCFDCRDDIKMSFLLL